MMKTSLVCLFSTLIFLGSPGHAQEYKTLTNGELLQPCVEGSSDARHGREILRVCERYIRGFIDLADWMERNGQPFPACIPVEPDRVGRVRRAFMKWATHNLKRHEENAVSGLISAIQSEYPCPEKQD